MTIKVVFFASPEIALPSLSALLDSEDFEVKALVTQPPRPSKRGNKILDSAVKKLAVSRSIEVLEPVKIAKEPDIIKKLSSYEADFFVTFAFGQILSQEILDIPKFHTINLHASLLPKYRGANPICACLLSGDEATGVSTMVTVLELDAGDICLTEEISLGRYTDYPQLARKISEISPDLILKTLKGLYEGSIKPYAQDSSAVSFTRKLTKADKNLSFENSVNSLHNKVRALCEINTCNFNFNGKIVQVLKTDFDENFDAPENKKCGEVVFVNKQGIGVKCGDGILVITEVKPEGKAKMPAYAWSLGSKIKTGDFIG